MNHEDTKAPRISLYANEPQRREGRKEFLLPLMDAD